MISAYTLAFGVKQRRFPWEAAILSVLSIADELCLISDERFDRPEIFTELSNKIKLIPVEIDFLEWDFINNLLTKARRSCSGEWCLLTSMDMVFDEKAQYTMPVAVKRADDLGFEAVHVCNVSPIQNLVQLGASSMQMLTKNMPYIYHKTSPYMIKIIDSDIWDGKCIKSYAFDDWSLYDERTDSWFNDINAEFVEAGFKQYEPKTKEEMEEKVKKFTHAWHYPFYNPGRRNEQGRQTSEWQDRTYGRRSTMDVPKLIKQLNTEIVINPQESLDSYNYFAQHGFIEVLLEHPSFVKEWVSQMGLEAI